MLLFLAVLGLHCSMQTSLGGHEGLVALRHVGSEFHDQGLEGVLLTTGPPAKSPVCSFFNTSTSLRAHPSQRVFLLIIPTPPLGHPELACAAVVCITSLYCKLFSTPISPFLNPGFLKADWPFNSFYPESGAVFGLLKELCTCLLNESLDWGEKYPTKFLHIKVNELKTVLNVAKSSFIAPSISLLGFSFSQATSW